MSMWGAVGGAGKALSDIGSDYRRAAIEEARQERAMNANKDQYEVVNQNGTEYQKNKHTGKLEAMPGSGKRSYMDPMVDARLKSLNGEIDALSGKWERNEQEEQRLQSLIGERDAIFGGGKPSSAPAEPQFNQQVWDKAAASAAKEAKEKAGWLSTASDFKDHGGSRERFIQSRTQEIYNQMTGNGGAKMQGGGLISGGMNQPDPAKPGEKPTQSDSTPSPGAMNNVKRGEDGYPVVTKQAAEQLLQNPDLAQQFDAMFGPGKAEATLKQYNNEDGYRLEQMGMTSEADARNRIAEIESLLASKQTVRGRRGMTEEDRAMLQELELLKRSVQGGQQSHGRMPARNAGLLSGAMNSQMAQQ